MEELDPLRASRRSSRSRSARRRSSSWAASPIRLDRHGAALQLLHLDLDEAHRARPLPPPEARDEVHGDDLGRPPRRRARAAGERSYATSSRLGRAPPRGVLRGARGRPRPPAEDRARSTRSCTRLGPPRCAKIPAGHRFAAAAPPRRPLGWSTATVRSRPHHTAKVERAQGEHDRGEGGHDVRPQEDQAAFRR